MQQHRALSVANNTTQAVRASVRRGMTLEARVEGSQYIPYRVVITLDEAGIQSPNCMCAYDFGGYRKHPILKLD
jgi:uncharacterized Zn finger protein